MKLAKTLMVQGTASTVGKSTIVTGLCRIFAQDGWRVAPFKAQNMALNSFVTEDGGEIGRAQVVQAEAAGIEPTVDMNPILLKPESDQRSQVIIRGRPLSVMEAQNYYQGHLQMRAIVESSLLALRREYDLVIIEGAGSPVELNLMNYDLVNMQVARLADAPVLLVGDIDRGGIFASLLGTLSLLEPADHLRVKGLIVNKFRGDLALWHDGTQILEQRAGIPVLGTIPFYHNISIAEEDSVPLDERYDAMKPQAYHLDVVVIRFPYISNYDEFDALALDPRVSLRFVTTPEEIPEHTDLIILPGTKNTFHDLEWLWRQGLATHIRRCARRRTAVFGICGGYQMMGERIYDPEGVEGQIGQVEAGLHLLEHETSFGDLSEKVTTRCRVHVLPQAAHGLLSQIIDRPLLAYQIHVGRTRSLSVSGSGDIQAIFQLDETGDYEGQSSADGWCMGSYLHGLFENETFCHNVIESLMRRRSWSGDYIDRIPQEPFFDRQAEYDKLALHLRTHLDLARLRKACDLPEIP